MGDKAVQKALDEYKTIYMAYRNFAERTRVEYLNDINDLVEFLERSGINNTADLSLPTIERYVALLEQRGYSSLTRKRKVVTIRSFLLFLYQNGYISSNIGKLLVLPFTESITPHILTQAECDRLRQACASDPRDNAIIELLLQTGIKLSELIRLTLDDVEIGERSGVGEIGSGFIRILGSRGKKERTIPLNDKASASLKSYMDTRQVTGNRTLFLNKFGENLGERGVQKMLRKHLISAGIENASVHTLRHTFGAHHLAKGTSPETVKKVMGLKDARSTLVYQTLAKNMISREIQENSL